MEGLQKNEKIKALEGHKERKGVILPKIVSFQ